MNFKITLFLALITTTTLAVDFGFPEEDDVLVLKDANFKQAINKFDFILVEFYAPGCEHCKKLAPEYANAAKELKSLETPIPIAKVDATENTNIAKEYGIQGYPTLKFFMNGSPIDYTGGMSQTNIVNWIKKKSGPPSTLLKDAAHLEKQKNIYPVLAAFFGDEDSAEFAAFKEAALSLDNVAFVHSTDDALKNANGGNAFTVFTQHNNGAAHFSGEYTKEALLAHIAKHRFSIVMDFDEDQAIERVFRDENPAIVYFSDTQTDFFPTFTEIAKADSTNSPPLIFLTSSVSSGMGQKLADYIGVSESDTPCIWIISPVDSNMNKFQYSGEFTKEAIQDYIASWRSGKLGQTYKSDEIPTENNKPVKVIVGKSFDSMVKNSGKYVLLEFYAPWCAHCKGLEPIFEELAKQHSGNEKIMIAKVDATTNDIPGVSISGFPTIKLFIPGKEVPVEFDGDRTIEAFNTFLKEQLGDDFTEPNTEL